MIKAKCSVCKKEFYCNGDIICLVGVSRSQFQKKIHECYCRRCTRKEVLDTENGIKKCYSRIAERTKPERVNFT